ncbi:nitronate monooxygenase [Peribacillus simplex]|uniref:NAD(P)H-dependent flavin oxidoreductase n=1 Tax=Peribacillus simplex TaxID=1478 RepID=UPI001924E759|nr:nitronate monooxygenase [Peribacillus simplex]
MNIKTNKRVEKILGIKFPIIQAPLNWLTNANFVAAVSEAGGLGVLGFNAGPLAKDETVSIEEKLRSEIREIRRLTDKPFGINLYSPKEGMEKDNVFVRSTLEVAFEEDVKIIIAVGEVNRSIFKEVKDRGGIVIFRELTPSVASAKIAEENGVDLIVATGYDEGGHIPQRQIGTFSIVPTIVDAVDIPVIATGGINDIRGVRAAFALGAEGVYVGTRFIVSEENPASEGAKQDIINSKAEDLLLVSGLQRSTPTKSAVELAEMYNNGKSTGEVEQEINKRGGLRTGMLDGKISEGIISVNTAIDTIKEKKKVKEIVDELMADFQ